MVTISGIRGVFGDGLDPEVLLKYAAGYGRWAKSRFSDATVVIGRDARVTGKICAELVASALQSVGCNVIDLGMATTPTVEMMVIKEKAAGGIILSASHNPAEWNALKLLNEKGEFLTPAQGQSMLDASEEKTWAPYNKVGTFKRKKGLDYHIEKILDLDFIHPEKIAARKFKVVVDGINSVGAFAIPALLNALGISDDQIVLCNGEANGLFAHNPEPLPANLVDTIQAVKDHNADLGIVVDPDADRLALIADGGVYFSEELTQVVAADFLWRFREGPFVTNLSSSRAIEDVAAKYGQKVYRSSVGEINVVMKMHEVNAALGGEGNGGVILPDLHHGRDALIGVAMILQHLVNENQSLSEVAAGLPKYNISKNKIDLKNIDADAMLAEMASRYKDERISTIDGVKIDFDEGWVHLRKSNTEPIIRIYAEAKDGEASQALAGRFIDEMNAVGT